MSKKGHKIVLSEENRRLLVRICRPYGTAKEAENDPNFVITQILKGVIEDQKNLGSSMKRFLRNRIEIGPLEYAREKSGHAVASSI